MDSETCGSDKQNWFCKKNNCQDKICRFTYMRVSHTYTKYFIVCLSQNKRADFGNFFEGTQKWERSFEGSGTNLG